MQHISEQYEHRRESGSTAPLEPFHPAASSQTQSSYPVVTDTTQSRVTFEATPSAPATGEARQLKLLARAVDVERRTIKEKSIEFNTLQKINGFYREEWGQRSDDGLTQIEEGYADAGRRRSRSRKTGPRIEDRLMKLGEEKARNLQRKREEEQRRINALAGTRHRSRAFKGSENYEDADGNTEPGQVLVRQTSADSGRRDSKVQRPKSKGHNSDDEDDN